MIKLSLGSHVFVWNRESPYVLLYTLILPRLSVLLGICVGIARYCYSTVINSLR